MPLISKNVITSKSGVSTTYGFGKFHRCVFIGDSINNGFQPTTQTHIDGWGARVHNYYNFETDGWYSFAMDGASFTNGNLLKTFTDNISKIKDPDSITEVFICAGANDQGSTSSNVRNAAKTFVSTVKSYCKNAKVIYGNLCFHMDSREISANARTIGSVLDSSTDIFDGVVPNLYLSCITVDSFNDKIRLHPNANGLNKIAQCLAQFISTGSCCTDSPITDYTFTPYSGISQIPTTWKIGVINGQTTVNIAYNSTGDTRTVLNFNNTSVSATDGSAGQSFKRIANIPTSCPLFPSITEAPQFYCDALLHYSISSSSGFTFANLGFYVNYDQTIGVYILAYNPSNHEFLTNAKLGQCFLIRPSGSFNTYCGY